MSLLIDFFRFLKTVKLAVLSYITGWLLITSNLFAYDSLIASADFVPIKTDVGTAATGIIGVVLVVLGLGVIIRVLSR